MSKRTSTTAQLMAVPLTSELHTGSISDITKDMSTSNNPPPKHPYQQYSLVSPLSQNKTTDDSDEFDDINPKLTNDDVNLPSLGKTSRKRPSIQWSHVKAQLQMVFRIALPYFQESRRGRWLVASLLFFLMLNNGMYILFSFVNRDFWSALANQNATEFYTVMVLYFVILLLLMAPINAWYTYQRDQLVLHWRSWLTNRTLELYTKHPVYYHMEQEIHQPMTPDDDWKRTWMDNPDQRITEDVKAFTDLSTALCFEFFDSVIQVFSFSAILWTIDPQLLGMAMVYAASGTILTTMIGHPLVQLNVEHLRREADLRYLLVRFRDHAEAIAFSFGAAKFEQNSITTRLQHVVTNQYRINLINRTLNLFKYVYSLSLDILPVAMVAPQYFAGKIEMGVINQSTESFATVVTSLSSIVYSFNAISEYAANVERLSRFYQAMADADETKRNSGSSSKDHTSLLRVAASKTSTFNQGQTDIEMQITRPKVNHRSSSKCQMTQGDKLCLAVGKIDLQRLACNSNNDAVTATRSNIVLQIEHLDLVTPNCQRRLIRDLNVTVTSGQHLLIVGASGIGKSSLLRAIAGLWTTGCGRIMRPADEDVYFLPQQPYCTLGSLRDQLMYPYSTPHSTMEPFDEGIMDWRFGSEECGRSDVPTLSLSRPAPSNLTDVDLIRILKQINLLEIASRAGDGDPIKGLSVVVDWGNVLSLGERQRLAFGRLLVHRPKCLVVLDEATSALDLYNEKCMYRMLRELATNASFPGDSGNSVGLAFVSVGHRPSLDEFHEMRLDLGHYAQNADK